MAKYDQLPIYRKGLELIVFLENAVRGFSRYHKYSIGERLRQTSWDVVTLVVRANNTPVAERRRRAPWAVDCQAADETASAVG